jgi:hypothetical protein
MLAASNAGVRWLVGRVQRQRFELRLGEAPALRTAG